MNYAAIDYGKEYIQDTSPEPIWEKCHCCKKEAYFWPCDKPCVRCLDEDKTVCESCLEKYKGKCKDCFEYDGDEL